MTQAAGRRTRRGITICRLGGGLWRSQALAWVWDAHQSSRWLRMVPSGMAADVESPRFKIEKTP